LRAVRLAGFDDRALLELAGEVAAATLVAYAEKLTEQRSAVDDLGAHDTTGPAERLAKYVSAALARKGITVRVE
jgi:hypothetical protein